MIGLFVEALGGVPVEDRTSEGGASHGIAVAAAGDVAAGIDEFEFASAGFAEEGHGAATEAAVFGVVVLNLLHDTLDVLGGVQAGEDVADHLLLILVEETGDALLHDVPVVIDLGAEGMIEGEADGGALLFAERFIERGGEGFRG